MDASKSVACFARIMTLHADGSVQISGPSNVVDIFNVRSGAWTTAALSASRYNLAATSLPNDGLAMFAGGLGALLSCQPRHAKGGEGGLICEGWGGCTLMQWSYCSRHSALRLFRCHVPHRW